MPAYRGLDFTTSICVAQDRVGEGPEITQILACCLLSLVIMKTQNHSSCRGFSLVELLIVAAIIGLIVAIALPNLLNAIQRSRQTRSVSDLRTVSIGLGLYNQDFAIFPPQASLEGVTGVSDELIPFIGEVPTADGWQYTFQYRSDGYAYTLASFGLNKAADTPWESGFTTYFDDDIVILDGEFFQIPEGAQNEG
jgi:general secretion pathway protein G